MTHSITSVADFKLFLAVWNRRQNQGTPAIHFRIANWLQSAWERGERRLLLMAFRSCGKSTILGLFAAWLLYLQPDLRILVLAADLALARKMVRNVKRIIERHPLTTHLKPAQTDQWGADRFTINRPLELRDPSVLAKGVTANITGSRADIVICDDVEVPNTSDTAEKRADLRERLAEIDFVLVPGGLQLYAGTPHSWFTVYTDEARAEIGETMPFLRDFSRLKLPILTEQGESAWPERFSIEDIERMRANGPNRFASQMMLAPVNIAEGRLDPSLLRRYDGRMIYDETLRQLFVNGKRMIAASGWWDPAFGTRGGDRSVLAAVYRDEENFYYLHHLAYLRVNPSAGGDEATAQCHIVAQIAKDLMLPSITVEINGIGRFLPGILRQVMAEARVPCAVMEANSHRAKDDRILEAFDAVLAARRLWAHESIYRTPFMMEMQEWKPGKAGGRDDGLDAVAGALSLHPPGIKTLNQPGRQTWMESSRQYQARIDFDV